MMLEVPVNLADRSEELKLEMNTAVERKNTPRCEVCQDNESRKCKESGTNYEGQPEKEAEKSSAAAKEEVESEFFKVGDLVDILDTNEEADTAGPSPPVSQSSRSSASSRRCSRISSG